MDETRPISLRETMRWIWNTHKEDIRTIYRVKKPYTYVRIYWKNTTFEGLGFAKCNPTDAWSTAVGFDVAFGRALKDMAQQYRRKQDIGSWCDE